MKTNLLSRMSSISDLGLVYTSPVNPTDNEWDAVLDFLLRSNLKLAVALIEGGAPNAEQRRRLRATMGKIVVKSKSAVLTSSLVVRTLITLIATFSGSDIHAFTPDNWAGVRSYLGINEEQLTTVRQEMDELKRDAHS